MSFKNFTDYATTSSERKLYTGLAAFKVLAINPTEKELGEILTPEIAAKFDTQYGVSDNSLLGIKTRPIVIWVQDSQEKLSPQLVSIEISKEPDVAQTGSMKFVNSKNNDTYSKDEKTLKDNPRMTWFTEHTFWPARIGEVEYYKFIDTLFRFNHTKDKTFFDFLKETNIDFETVLKGDFKGLKELVAFCKEEGKFIGGVAAVREKGDGMVQDVVINSDIMFRTSGQVLSGNNARFLKLLAQKEEEGYLPRGLKNREYSVEFQEYTGAPAEVKTKETPIVEQDEALDDWLNF